MRIKSVLILVIVALLASASPSWAQAKKRVINRYSHNLLVQKDGSYGINDKVLEVLDGDIPDDLYTPYTPVPRVPKEDVAEVPCEEVVYKTYPDHDLKIYIVPPLNPEQPAPVVCFIHGGGWTNGNPSSFVLTAKYVAKYGGLAAVSIGYSLSKYENVDINVSMQDLHDAIQYLRDHAEQYHLDTSRLAFVGSSAGGHLSAMMAFTEPDTKVLSGWSGPYDIEDHMTYWNGSSGIIKINYFHGDDPDQVAAFSPLNLVPRDRQIAVQLFQGTGDPSVHADQAYEFEKALKAAGHKTVECNIYRYYGHGLTGSSDKARECLAKFLEFTKQHIYD